MVNLLRTYFITAVMMLSVDMLWLTFRYKYHNDLIKSVQHSTPNVRIIPALMIYLILPAAVIYFAIFKSKTAFESALKGALLGASIYSVYDLTNLATFKDWTVEMTIIDILWGTFINSFAAYFGFIISSYK
jgi:uncharacterized membrane protein